MSGRIECVHDGWPVTTPGAPLCWRCRSRLPEDIRAGLLDGASYRDSLRQAIEFLSGEKEHC